MNMTKICEHDRKIDIDEPGVSIVAEQSKALYTGSRGRGFESRSWLFSSFYLDRPLSSLFSLLSSLPSLYEECTMHDDDARKEEELKEKNQDSEFGIKMLPSMSVTFNA